MQSKIYNNVVGQKVLNNGTVCEDVTSVTIPEITHPTTGISDLGLVMNIDMPDNTRVEAMEFSVNHNNGVGCKNLGTPGKHEIEVRLARQVFSQATQDMTYESVKYRITGMHKSTSTGTAETGNPLGSTEKFSVLRFEKYVNGNAEIVIDTTKITINGKTYTDPIDALLN